MNERDELEDEYNAQWGDPRRCPVHGIATSSPDGMFDAPCWACEGEGQEEAHAYAEEERRGAMSQDERDAEDARYAARNAAAQAARKADIDDTPF